MRKAKSIFVQEDGAPCGTSVVSFNLWDDDDKTKTPNGSINNFFGGVGKTGKKAIEIANSPNIGVCLCVGSWLEGGTMTGKDPVEMIKYFGPRKKLFKIHFRNVSAPLPHFSETLIDDGYYDMSKVMQALVDVDFDGIVIPDHIPTIGSAPGQQGGRERELLPHAVREIGDQRRRRAEPAPVWSALRDSHSI